MEPSVFNEQVISLTNLLSIKYHGVELSDLKESATPSEWFNKALSHDLPKEEIQSFYCRFFSIRYKSEQSLVEEQALPFDGGYFLEGEGVYYLRDVSSELLFKSKSNHGAIVKGMDQPIRPFDSLNESQKNTTQGIIEYHLSLFEHANVKHLELKRNALLMRVGRFSIPLNTIALNYLPDTSVEFMENDFFCNAWSESVSKFISHISKRSPGNKLFLFGDYIDVIEDYIKKEIAKKSFFSVSKNGCITKGAVNIVDLDFLSASELSKIKELSACQETYFIFLSKSRNFVRLFSILKSMFSLEDLIKNWGGHASITAIPRLCDKCKKASKNSSTISYPLVDVTESIENSFSKGLGCSFCVDGYDGVVFVKEHLSIEDKEDFVGVLVSSYKESSDESAPDFLTSKQLSPYNVASRYYKVHQSMPVSLKSSVTDALIQISDTENLLV